MANRAHRVFRRARTAAVRAQETPQPSSLPLTGGNWPAAEARLAHSQTETVALDADIFDGLAITSLVTQLVPGGPTALLTLGIPATFQAIHASLIPRGPNRGKVMVWNAPYILGTLAGGWNNGEEWAMQLWSIFDPATTPAGVRYQNFILPLAPRELVDMVVVTPNVGANTFTAPGHAFQTGSQVMLTVDAGGTMPAPFAVNAWNYVEYIDANTIRLWTNEPNPALRVPVVLTSPGSGTRRIARHFIPALFCAGHAWDPEGRLVVAGGTRFEISNGGEHNTYRSTWVWDPTSDARYAFTAGGPNGIGPTYPSMERVDLGRAIDSNHYESAVGCWIQGPDLEVARYYPTVAMTAPMDPLRATHADLTCALVLGGETPDTPDGVALIDGSYESLVCNAAPTVTGPGPWHSGLVREQNGGLFSWPGPSAWDATTNPLPDGNPYKDGLYYYPHMHNLADGRLFMSGFVHRSATLDHDAAPGTWTTTEGHADVPGLINAFRYYPCSVHWIDAGVDIVMRMGGGQVPVFEVPDFPVFTMASHAGNTMSGGTHNFVTGLAVEVTNDGGAPPAPLAVFTTYFAIRISATQLQIASSLVNALAGIPFPLITPGTGTTRVAADYTSGLIGDTALYLAGYRPTPYPELPIDTRTVEEIRPGTPGAQWTAAPSLERPHTLANAVWLADGSLAVIGGVNFDDSTIVDEPPALHPLLDHSLHGEDHAVDHDDGHGDLPTVGIYRGDFIFHTVVEVRKWGGTRWESLDWASGQSSRGYHSTALLLPDARVLVAGGEDREFDYEIWTPHYLQPSHDHLDLVPARPTGITIPLESLVDSTYELDYGTSYTLTSAALAAGRRLSRVTLCSPGSCTHHRDWSQRFANLVVDTSGAANSIGFTLPANVRAWLPGYAMLFVLDDMGVPAEAIWIKLPQP